MSSLSLSLLGELDHELSQLRKTIERIPSEQLNFKPHPKSMTLSQLGTHLAQIPFWGAMTLTTPEVDLAQPWEQPDPKTTEEILAILDRSVSEFRAALEPASEETMQAPWTLRKGEHVIFTMPRAQLMRGMIMNHLIHHRGQLSVYLRLLDVPVPALYGPSADEAN